jgi:hypothetical protein
MHIIKDTAGVQSKLMFKKSLHFFDLFQAEIIRDAAWGCDWVGTPVHLQRCLVLIIASASKEFTLTAGKFVPVSNSTMINVRILIGLSTVNLQYQIIINMANVSNNIVFHHRIRAS